MVTVTHLTTGLGLHACVSGLARQLRQKRATKGSGTVYSVLSTEKQSTAVHLLECVSTRACLSAEPNALRRHRSVEFRRKSLGSGRASLGSGRLPSLQHATTEPSPTMQVHAAEYSMHEPHKVPMRR